MPWRTNGSSAGSTRAPRNAVDASRTSPSAADRLTLTSAPATSQACSGKPPGHGPRHGRARRSWAEATRRRAVYTRSAALSRAAPLRTAQRGFETITVVGVEDRERRIAQRPAQVAAHHPRTCNRRPCPVGTPVRRPPGASEPTSNRPQLGTRAGAETAPWWGAPVSVWICTASPRCQPSAPSATAGAGIDWRLCRRCWLSMPRR